ncbi:MAG: uroporphyrinogen-III C-methyltransferase [Opitutaceae bacterium]|nr:uroporphyrinogen-III C-methyltransferase [Opitutaceae bacterium]
MPVNQAGIVYLVGAGPGAIGLLTLRGAELLRTADVVIYDGLANAELLELAPSTAELISVSKHERTHCVSQDDINRLLLARARAGKRVVRLKGGDPYLFGRGGEETEILAEAGISFEIVPGVSSIQSVPAYAGIPLTHRNHSSSVTIVTGHPARSPANRVDWAEYALIPGTLVVLMGSKNIREIAAALIRHGRAADTPTAVISRGTTEQQRTVVAALESIADRVDQSGIVPPAIVVIGEVVELREKLAWFERHGCTPDTAAGAAARRA